MKLTVKLDFGCGREIKVGTFSEIGRDTALNYHDERNMNHKQTEM